MTIIRGRFQKPADKAANKYTASIPFDHRLYPYDIAGSIAHARMLAKQGIISSIESGIIVAGLTAIRQKMDDGVFDFKMELEDIHMNIEATLIEDVGDAGRKLHTARSRNDQIALDMRLFTRHAIARTRTAIRELERVLVGLADTNKKTVISGLHAHAARPTGPLGPPPPGVFRDAAARLRPVR